MSDPGLPLNCPHCGIPLVYTETVGVVHSFICDGKVITASVPTGPCEAERANMVGRRPQASGH